LGKTVGMIVAIVAAVAIAVAAPYLAPIALGALGITATATAVAIATAVIGMALSIGVSIAFKALGVGAPKAENQVGPPQVFRQSISDAFMVYGKRRVGGLMVFFHSIQGGTGAHFRYFVVAVAGHRSKQVDQWMLNDELVSVDGAGKVTSGKYANNAWLWFQRGLSTETANATFVAECGGKWTTAHRGDGVTAIYAKFKLTDDVVQAGMPNITAVIEGKDDILDPRDGTHKYTNNGPLVFYDWMAIPREEGGFGAYDDEIPVDSWISAQANVADETVGGEPRYALDAYLTTGSSPAEVRDAMIVNMAGTYSFSGGKHLMRPGYWVPPSATLSEDDLASAIQVSPFMPADAAANEVQGTFIDPAANYQGQPFATQTVASTDIKQLNVDLAFITSLNRANRIAAIMLKRAECEKTVIWPMNIAGIGLRALDTVQLDSTRYGLNNYAWVVSNWALSADYGVVLQLREENADIYDDASSVTPATPPTVVVPDPVMTGDELQSALRSTYARGLQMDGIDAGISATIRLYGSTTSNPFNIDYPGSSVSVGPVSLTGLLYNHTYFPYCDVAKIGDAAPTFGVTDVYSDALNSAAHPTRLFFGRSVTTPIAGGGATTGGGSGGGYGGGGGYNPPGGGLTNFP
jgi:hypothetical protein